MIRCIVVLIVAASFPALAQPVIFNHRVEDRQFLHYYYIWNHFDSSVVMYEFGEVAFVDGTTRRTIPLSNLVVKGQKIQGAGTQGISADIQAIARTEDFPLSGEGEIQWFGRLQSFRTPCDDLPGYDTAQGEGPNRPVTTWGVLDRTEFVVQLVDAGTNTVLATLDSLGVHPTGAVPPAVDTRYGTNLHRVRRSFTVPASLAGTTAYVRISPRRYGATPFELTISKYSSWVNLTAQYDSTGTTAVPNAAARDLRNRWFSDLLMYCDSVKAETGWLPDLQGSSFSDNNHLSTYRNRYFTPHIDSATGETVWFERHTAHSAKRGALVSRTTGHTRTTRAPIAQIRSVAPNPIAGNADLVLYGTLEMTGRLVLMSMEGKRVGTLWQGFLQKGPVTLVVAIPDDVANGSYLLVLEQENGGKVHQKTVVVAR